MTSFKITHEDCMRMVRGMKRLPDSPSGFLVYCCKDSNICVKMGREELLVFYNEREEHRGREDMFPVAFKNHLTFKITK